MVRRSPTQSATLFRLGTVKKGNDNNLWKIIKTKNGVKRWQKISSNTKKTTNKSSRKVRKSRSKGKKNIKEKKLKSKKKEQDILEPWVKNSLVFLWKNHFSKNLKTSRDINQNIRVVKKELKQRLSKKQLTLKDFRFHVYTLIRKLESKLRKMSDYERKKYDFLEWDNKLLLGSANSSDEVTFFATWLVIAQKYKFFLQATPSQIFDELKKNPNKYYRQTSTGKALQYADLYWFFH